MPEIKLMDFYSDWCAPCKKQSPIIDELSNEYEEVYFEKIDIEEKPDLSNKYNVSAIPTIVIECGEEVEEKFVGLTDKEKLKQSLDKVISNC